MDIWELLTRWSAKSVALGDQLRVGSSSSNYSAYYYFRYSSANILHLTSSWTRYWVWHFF